MFDNNCVFLQFTSTTLHTVFIIRTGGKGQRLSEVGNSCVLESFSIHNFTAKAQDLVTQNALGNMPKCLLLSWATSQFSIVF